MDHQARILTFSSTETEALWIYPDYLRNICKIIPSALPRDVSTLNEIRNEAKFLELDELSKTLEVNGIFYIVCVTESI